MLDYKPPTNLRNELRRNAPSSTLSENYGRSGGYFGDYDEETVGYSSILIYIQLGLAEHYDIILEVVRLMLSIQSGYEKKYSLLPAAFGTGTDFIHKGKYFDLGYMTDNLLATKIAEALRDLSGTGKSEIPAILPEFFPKTDMRSLYSGKTSFDKKDFMVIIARKGEWVLAEHLQDKITYDFKKRILLVEIDEEAVNWKYRDVEFEFN